MICWSTPTQFAEMYEKALTELRKARTTKSKYFDGIVCSGYSGVTMGTALGAALKVPVYLVRDKGDRRHHNMGVFPSIPRTSEKLLFLDDHISGGTTFRHCQEVVSPYGAKISLSFEYNPAWGIGNTRQKVMLCSDHPKLMHYYKTKEKKA